MEEKIYPMKIIVVNDIILGLVTTNSEPIAFESSLLSPLTSKRNGLDDDIRSSAIMW